ncbi:cysteine dioxygenase [Actinomadura sp. 21ATH]|uniref:cysteine dioxygenase n=1 Tax=Actinomadura sp. 21ATH TaxID=1735444 RepID=UPI0035C25E39
MVRRPPTVGQLAERIHALSARPGEWWHRARFEEGPVRVPLDEVDGVRLWLTTWPPGHRTDVHVHTGTEVSTVIAGELAEVKITGAGVTERPLRTNRVRVHGGGRTHELTNPGPAYAITLHATLA